MVEKTLLDPFLARKGSISYRVSRVEVAFADHHPADFQRMVQEASGSYLFAISCFNVSHMLAPRRENMEKTPRKAMNSE